ncbi:MAG: hypothetical protein J6T10_05475, partial [Methanobrevibacter sp.]|nr:hypothetical protein [Methanobrevibacter sp.]
KNKSKINLIIIENKFLLNLSLIKQSGSLFFEFHILEKLFHKITLCKINLKSFGNEKLIIT